MTGNIGELDHSYYTELATKILGYVVNFVGVRIIGRAWTRWHCGRRMMKVAAIYRDLTTRRDRKWTSKRPVLFCTHPECGFYEDTSKRRPCISA